MKIVVIAVGTRMPVWIASAFADYAGRMPKSARLSLIEVKAESRTSGKSVEQLMAAEGERITAAVPGNCECVVLDERGRDFTTAQLAQWLEGRMGGGRDLTFVIGGPDGLSAAIKTRAAMQMRLSSLTLPHGLARVLLAEQLYRAMSIIQNHPYHRE